MTSITTLSSLREPLEKRRPWTWLFDEYWNCRQSLSLEFSIRQPALSSEEQYTPFKNPLLSTDVDNTAPPAQKLGLWHRFASEFRKNYSPRKTPPLVLPTAPTDKEKYSYVALNRPFLVSCAAVALIALGVGAWQFAHASPIYSWYAVYVFISEIYLFTSLFITVVGKRFDVEQHRRTDLASPVTETTAPTVDIFLPVCREPLEILENTWTHIAALQYPGTQKSIHVLDDGADNSVKSLALRFGFSYVCRANRPELKKAGNLRHAFCLTSGEFFAVFDADFCPRPEFLLETVPYLLEDPKVAILQTPQFFRSSGNQTWVEQGAGAAMEYCYRMLQQCYDKWGGSICVGTNAVYRRAALEPIGGTVPTSSCEDVHTGFYVVANGWKLKPIPLVLACGTCPDTPRAFFGQQMRWCTGTMALLLQRSFWTSSLSVKQKLCYTIGVMYYITTAIQPFMGPLPAPLILWTRPDLFKYYNLFFAFPNLLLSLIALRIWTRCRHTLSVQYVQILMSYAYLQAILDLMAGTKSSSWVPSGVQAGGKAHKNRRYRNMRVLAWGWTITHTSLLVSAGAYRVTGGMPWYNLVPVLVIDAFNLLCLHRFLLYQHPKD
ncbi:MAG: hypothetical protein Q9191_002341 [Dirinaria sp. TL-2023a]